MGCPSLPLESAAMPPAVLTVLPNHPQSDARDHSRLVQPERLLSYDLHFENEITSRIDWIRPSLTAASVSCMEDSTV